MLQNNIQLQFLSASDSLQLAVSNHLSIPAVGLLRVPNPPLDPTQELDGEGSMAQIWPLSKGSQARPRCRSTRHEESEKSRSKMPPHRNP